MIIEKLNESYSVIDADREILGRITDFLKVENPNAHFDKMVQLGLKGRFTYFCANKNGKLIIYNGHRCLLKNFGIEPVDESSNITDLEIDTFLDNLKFPFTPYDYQLRNIKLALKNNKMLFRSCTGSGKSLTISTILEFFRRKKLRGVLIVPTINLLTQFKSDIESYGFNSLNKEIQLFGNGHVSDFKSCLTITTWQSLQREIPNLEQLNFDYIIVDEAHKSSADILRDILLKSVHTKIKLGFTGTLPEDPVAKMTLLGLFGVPTTIITSRELIDRGLATPVKIKTIFIHYPFKDREIFNSIPSDAYLKKLEFLKNNDSRQNLIVQLAIKQHNENKNTLILFQHTEHGKDIFNRIMKVLYPSETTILTGKESFNAQKEYKVFFMNGEQPCNVREKQRKYMEEENGIILIANYSLASTGINIKNLHTLIFASPLKAFTTVSQSLGRLMRKHKNKSESVIFDLVDDFGYRKPAGIFVKQYKHRLSSSYLVEEFDISEHFINL